MKAFKVNHIMTDTRELLATVRLEVHLSASEIAALLIVDEGSHWLPDSKVKVTEASIRHAVADALSRELDGAAMSIGDERADALWGEITDVVRAKVFGGRRYLPAEEADA